MLGKSLSVFLKQSNFQSELLVIDSLPKFHQVLPSEFKKVIKYVISDAKKIIKSSIKTQAMITWEGFVWPIEQSLSRVCEVYNLMSHLQKVKKLTYGAVFAEIQPIVEEFFVEVYQHKDLYRLYDNFTKTEEFLNDMSAGQKKVILKILREYKKNAVHLEKNERERFADIKQKNALLSNKFSQNVVDYVKQWSFFLPKEDGARIKDLPESVSLSAAQEATKEGKDGFLFKLYAPIYSAIMEYCSDEELRKIFYESYYSIASDYHSISVDDVCSGKISSYDNSLIMQQIVENRKLQSELLGFKSYAQYSLEEKMAKSEKNVWSFLQEIHAASYSKAQHEIADLKAFAEKKDGKKDFHAWDLAYYINLMRKERINLDNEELKRYFQLKIVLSTMFDVAQKLYGLNIVEKLLQSEEKWHEDVRFFEVHSSTGELIGSFYMDLYFREGKEGGAWVSQYRSRMKYESYNSDTNKEQFYIQKPIGFLVTNFMKSELFEDILLYYMEVRTLFHEFGHMLHMLLTDAELAMISGTEAVEFDAVELPSQIMENWVLEREVLDRMAIHYKTGEKMSEDLFQKLQKSKVFFSGCFINRQLCFGFYDFLLHCSKDVKDFPKTIYKQSIEEVNEHVRTNVMAFPFPKEIFARAFNAFSHIYDGGYAAGYYGYLWADVLVEDIFAAFKERGIFNKEVANSFLVNILQKSDASGMEEMFVAFRGRKPDIKYWLKTYGMDG